MLRCTLHSMEGLDPLDLNHILNSYDWNIYLPGLLDPHSNRLQCLSRGGSNYRRYWWLKARFLLLEAKALLAGE